MEEGLGANWVQIPLGWVVGSQSSVVRPKALKDSESPEGARHNSCPPVGRPAKKETGLFGPCRRSSSGWHEQAQCLLRTGGDPGLARARLARASCCLPMPPALSWAGSHQRFLTSPKRSPGYADAKPGRTPKAEGLRSAEGARHNSPKAKPHRRRNSEWCLCRLM